MERGGCITAVVVYNNFIPTNSIDMHVAAVDGGRWLTRPFLAAVFRYPFEQLGVRRVTARIGANNLKARNFLVSLGFTHEGTIRQGWEADTDLLIFGLLKNECKFLGERFNGQAVCTERP
jgi:RimJ/RimL family protein N-acetyltransferase